MADDRSLLPRGWQSALFFLGLMLLVASWQHIRAYAQDPPPEPTFYTVEVWIKTDLAPLSAYQLQIEEPQGFEVVGVEGGRGKGFAKPPYYDPEPLRNDILILAAFHTLEDAPVGQVHVATLHLYAPLLEQLPKVTLKLAANADGEKFDAHAELRRS